MEIQKSCSSCKDVKTLENFSKVKGHIIGSCKSCASAKMRVYYQKNKDKIKKRVAEYRQTPEGKASQKRSLNSTKSRRPKVMTAVWAVQHAIRAGKMVRLPCEKCGQPQTQAHHPDYNKPLSVMWLCLTHHREWHSLNKAIY